MAAFITVNVVAIALIVVTLLVWSEGLMAPPRWLFAFLPAPGGTPIAIAVALLRFRSSVPQSLCRWHDGPCAVQRPASDRFPYTNQRLSYAGSGAPV